LGKVFKLGKKTSKNQQILKASKNQPLYEMIFHSNLNVFNKYVKSVLSIEKLKKLIINQLYNHKGKAKI
jgi:hypothetical protein